MRKLAGGPRTGWTSRIEEVLSDVTHDMGEAAALEKDGVERDLQEALAAAPEWCGEGFRLVRREWPTDIGPVDLMCRDGEDGWIAVEIKRVGTIDAVEQLTRYLERIRLDPATGRRAAASSPREVVKPQARVLAEARGIAWVEVDLAVLRGEREPDLTLFARMSTTEAAVLTERRGNVLVITLNRPDARNAVNAALAEGIAAALDELDADDDLRVGILTGAGRGSAPGMDLKAFVTGRAALVRRPRLRRDRPARRRTSR